MQLESVKIRGLGPFTETVSIDFGELGDALLVAVAGENGAGKSTLLELAGAASMYRTTPTRGTLAKLAVSRDAMLEATLLNGKRYRVRHVVDNISGKGESVAFDDEGRQLFDSSKVSDFDRMAAKAFPAPEVTFATTFAAQGSGGFLAADPGPRTSILLRALGIESLKGLTKLASEHKSTEQHQVDTLRARIDDERARGGDGVRLVAELAEARTAALAAEQTAETARQALESARKEADQAAEAARAYRAATEHRARLQADSEQAQAERADLDKRIAKNQGVIDEAAAIRRAVVDIEGNRKRLADLKAESARVQSDLAAVERRASDVASQIAATKRRQTEAERRLAEGEAVRQAVAELPGLEAEAQKAERLAKLARAKLEELQGQSLAGAEDRIVGLRGALIDIATETSGDSVRFRSFATTRANSGLEEDDQSVEAARVFPGRVEAARVEVQRLENEVRAADRALSNARTRAAQAAAIEHAQADRDAAVSDLERLTREQDECQASREELSGRLAPIGAEVAELEADTTRLEPLAQKAGPLEGAEARLAEYTPRREELSNRIEAIATELTDTPEPGLPPPAPVLSAFERDAEAASQAKHEAASNVTLLESQLKAAQESAERLATLEAELSEASAELSDWTRLAQDLGPKGLQLTLIDSAGPEITDVANELLRECHGPRFSVRVETQRLSADKKKLIDGCDVVVIDSLKGREAPGETFSGGERVIIGEALSLALTVVACRRSGVRGVTLIRDETAGQLSPKNAVAYLGMLRRSADMVGASRVLFVAHDPNLRDMADATISIQDGKITVT